MENINNDVSETKRKGEWYEISEDGIGSVLETLIEFWPESLNIYNFINENVELGSKSGRTKTGLFRNSKNGLLIATTKGSHHRAVVFSPDKNYSGVESAFEGYDVVNWNDGSILFSGIPLDLVEYLKEVSSSIGKRVFNVDEVYDCYWIPAEVAKAINVECPDDMYFSKLEDIHVDMVNSNWPYSSDESFGFISDIIKFKDTVGLYTKKDSELVSWVLNTFYGIGMLYTIEEHRKKGYGTLALKKLVKILGQSGRNPVLVTSQNNLAAKCIFHKIGFVFIESLQYPIMEHNLDLKSKTI